MRRLPPSSAHFSRLAQSVWLQTKICLSLACRQREISANFASTHWQLRASSPTLPCPLTPPSPPRPPLLRLPTGIRLHPPCLPATAICAARRARHHRCARMPAVYGIRARLHRLRAPFTALPSGRPARARTRRAARPRPSSVCSPRAPVSRASPARHRPRRFLRHPSSSRRRQDGLCTRGRARDLASAPRQRERRRDARLRLAGVGRRAPRLPRPAPDKGARVRAGRGVTRLAPLR
jgi:hypothetical protein